MDNILIGNRIKEARTMRNMTLDDIADDIGVAKSTIQRYEAGKITKLKLPVIQAIANSLDVNPVWLSGYDAPMFQKKAEKPEGYYLDPETAERAQAMKDNDQLRLLFDTARDSRPEDIQTAYDVLLALKRKEAGSDD